MIDDEKLESEESEEALPLDEEALPADPVEAL